MRRIWKAKKFCGSGIKAVSKRPPTKRVIYEGQMGEEHEGSGGVDEMAILIEPMIPALRRYARSLLRDQGRGG